MILSLALALCMVCGLALAEGAPAEAPQEESAVTRTIVITNDKGEVIKEIVVTRVVTKNADGTETVLWLDENNFDWGDDDVIVLPGHDFEFDTDYPENSGNVTVLFLPTDVRNGQFRVHCKNHPLDKEDVREYTIYRQDHHFLTEKEVLKKIAAGDTAGFVSYKAPNCATGKAGSAVVACDCDPAVHWDYETGRYVAHEDNCKVTKKYTIKAEHLWSDENPDKAQGQPYHDLLKPTCYEGGKVVGYCLLCGVNKNVVLGDEYIYNVEPLHHHDIYGAPAWEERVKQEPNCKYPGITTLWCKICEDWIPDDEAFAINAKYPIITEPNGKHVYSKWIFDAYAVKEVNGVKVEDKETCTGDGNGYFHRICQICHTVFGTELRRIPATGHEWGSDDEFGWVPTAGKIATCTEPGQEERTCSKCKGKEVGGHEVRVSKVDNMNHVYVVNGKVVYENGVPKSALILDEAQKPTCLNAGYYQYHCDMCQQIVKEIAPALGHDWDNVKHQEGWCGGNDKPDKYGVCENHTYDLMTCKRCHEVKIVEDYGAVAHNFNPWELRNVYELYADGQWTPEYWVRYCKNTHKRADGTIEKCAFHEDFIRDFAVYAVGKTPEDVLAEESEQPPVIPEVPNKDAYTLPEDVNVEKEGVWNKLTGAVEINKDAKQPKYAYVRLTMFYEDGSAEVTFTAVNMETGTFTYAYRKDAVHVSAIVLDNNVEINDVPEDQQYSEGTGWDL